MRFPIRIFTIFYLFTTFCIFSFASSYSDWEGAQWIGAIKEQDAGLPGGNNHHFWGLPKKVAAQWKNVDTLAKRSIILRKEFKFSGKISSASVSVCGLGHYRLFINGKEIAPEVMFKPLWSEYEKTVYYNTFDVSDMILGEENAIAVMLGNGMYNVAGGRYVKFYHSYGPPTLLLKMELNYEDGSKKIIVSDGTWKFSPSPVTFNCIFGGESYDARQEQPGWDSPGFDDSLWRPVVTMEGPSGVLVPQTAPGIGISECFDVQDCWIPARGRWIFDMGQNLSGFPIIKVRGKKGSKIRLVPAERIEKDSSAVIQSSSGAPYWFEYTLKGDGIEEWHPDFSYYGYRYLQTDNAAMPNGAKARPEIISIKSCFVHSMAETTGTFECSNDLFNRIHFIIDKAARSNMQAVFTDCPHREKLGWLEETHLNGPGLLFNYDLRDVFPKVMRDIADSQHSDGLIPDIAPEYVTFKNGFIDSPEWGAAGAVVPWMYYLWYGDDSLIREYYPMIRKYADYLASKADGFILEYGLGDWCDYGPEPAGYSQNTPQGITATGHFLITVGSAAMSAWMTGDKKSYKEYSRLYKNIVKAFNDKFLDIETGVYGNGSQCSYAIPVYMDIVPSDCKDKVLENLKSSVAKAGGKLTTGDVGNRYLFQALANNGMNEIMYRMHNHYELPGYGYQVSQGVTTLTEQWNPELGLSWNHFMMGQIEEWFYKSLGGIAPDLRKPGFRHFYISPAVVGDLEWVKCSYNSVRGLVKSEWRIEDGFFILEILVPEASKATVTLPFGNGRPVKVGAGRHVFKEKTGQ